MGNGAPYFCNEKRKGGNGLRFTHCHPVAGGGEFVADAYQELCSNAAA
jgi:hypothetical protein